MPLKVVLVSCSDLKHPDGGYVAAHPFVVFSLDGQQQQASSAIRNTLNPVWKPPEVFLFEHDVSPSSAVSALCPTLSVLHSLLVTVKDKDGLPTDKIGSGSVNLGVLPIDVEQSVEVDLGKHGGLFSKKHARAHLKITRMVSSSSSSRHASAHSSHHPGPALVNHHHHAVGSSTGGPALPPRAGSSVSLLVKKSSTDGNKN